MTSTPTSSAHTPGSWYVFHDDEDGVTVCAENGCVVAICDSLTVDDDNANARLIATAPKLLAELRAYSERIIGDPEDGDYRACCGEPYDYTKESGHAADCSVIAVIAEAEGKA